MADRIDIETTNTRYITREPDTPRNRGERNAPHRTPVTPAEDIRSIMINRVSWGAVMAGVAMALAVQLVLNLLGVGIGAATIDPATGETPAPGTFSMAAAAWWAVSGIVASLLGGYAAGRMAGEPRASTTGWHGLTSWAASVLVVAVLMTTALGAAFGGVFQTMSVNPPETIAGADTDTVESAALSALQGAVTGDPARAAMAREDAAVAIAQSQGITIDQARARVADYEARSAQTADLAADSVARASIFAAVALVLGALAAWLGGRAGAIDPTITSGRLRFEESLH